MGAAQAGISGGGARDAKPQTVEFEHQSMSITAAGGAETEAPQDYAHGGENTAPGIGTQTWWNDGAMGGNNSITLYEATYSVIA